MSSNRVIYTFSASKQLQQLLQAVIAGELIAPSKKLWVFSPWISNIPLLDNSAYAFRHIEPMWPRGMVHFTAVLEKFLEKGTEIFIMTKDDAHNEKFYTWISQMHAKNLTRVKAQKKNELHQKGLLGDGFLIKGSMNFTFNGVSNWDESIDFSCDPATIAKAKDEFEYQWGK